MREQEYKDFSLRVHMKGTRRPIVGQFELTHRCNLRCRHCYIVNNHQKRELTYVELCRIFDEVHAEGCLWLCLTGGDPLLREDFQDIYRYAYRKGFIITLFTNATLMTKDTAEFLREFPPFCIEVTLNGATEKTYESITGVPGSFRKAVQGIETIRDHGLPMKLKCQIMTLNVHELDTMRRFYEGRGYPFRASSIIDTRIDGSKEPCSLRLSAEKLLELEGKGGITEWDDEIENNFKKGRSSANNGPVPSAENELFHCPGGTWTFYVSPFGELFFCNSVRTPSWNLKEDPFREGFYGLFPRIRSAKFKTDSKCRRCSIRHLCHSCPGRAVNECGDPEAPVEYYCRLAQLSSREEKGLKQVF